MIKNISKILLLVGISFFSSVYCMSEVSLLVSEIAIRSLVEKAMSPSGDGNKVYWAQCLINRFAHPGAEYEAGSYEKKIMRMIDKVCSQRCDVCFNR